MTTYFLDRTICERGFLAMEDGTPASGAPVKGEFAVSAFDPTVGGPYGAFLYISDCEPTPDVTVSADTNAAEYFVLQPSRVYQRNQCVVYTPDTIELLAEVMPPTVIYSLDIIVFPDESGLLSDSMTPDIYGSAGVYPDEAGILSESLPADIYGDANNYPDTVEIMADSLSATVSAAAPAPGPVADFHANETYVWALDPVVFTSDSTGDITSYAWNFGTGSIPETSVSAGPLTVYFPYDNNPTPPETYVAYRTISLTVTGPGGTNTKTKVDYIHIHAFAPPPSE